MSDHDPGVASTPAPEITSGPIHKGPEPDGWSLVKHIIVVLGIAILMALAPFVFEIIVRGLKGLGLDPMVVFCLEKLHLGVFFLDYALLMRFIVVKFLHSWNSMKLESSTGHMFRIYFRSYFEPLANAGLRASAFFKENLRSRLLHYLAFTFLGIGIGLALLLWIKWRQYPQENSPDAGSSHFEAPLPSDHSARPSPKDPPVHPSSPGPEVQLPTQTPPSKDLGVPPVQPEVTPPAQALEFPPVQPEVTPPAPQRKPIRIPTNTAPSKEPPVMAQEPSGIPTNTAPSKEPPVMAQEPSGISTNTAPSKEPPAMAQEKPSESHEPVAPVPVPPVPLTPTRRPEPAPEIPSEARITVGGDSIDVFPRTGPTLIRKATFGKLPKDFESRLTDMRLYVRVSVDEVGHAVIISDVEFPANFPASLSLRGRLSSQVKELVEKSVWKAARDENGAQIAKEIILAVVLYPSPKQRDDRH